VRILYHTYRLWLHELALHVDHSPEDFKAPYQMGVIHPSQSADVPIKPLVESISKLVESSHALLDGFLAISPEKARSLPVFIFVRVSFAGFVLVKLCLSASSISSRIKDLIDVGNLNTEEYMDRTIWHCRSIVGTNECRVPALFLALLFKMRLWCKNPGMIEAYPDNGPRDIWPEGPEEANAENAVGIPRFVEEMANKDMSSSGVGRLQRT
jgi:hypothetical protein